MKSRIENTPSSSKLQSTDSARAASVSTIDMLQSAVRLHHQGHLEEAEALYNQILQLQPNHFEVLQLLATIALQKSTSKGGRELQGIDLSKATGVSTTDMLQSAVTLHQQGKLGEAEALYKRILQAEPANFEASQLLAAIAVQKSNFIDAIELFDKAIKINTSHQSLLNSFGIVLHQLKRYDEALFCYNKAITLQPNDLDIYSNRHNAFQELKPGEDPLQSGERFVESTPEHADVYFNLGNLFFDLKRYDEALQSYDKAVASESDYAEAHYQRGAVLLELHRYEEALKSYDRAIAVKPDYADARAKREKLLKEREHSKEASSSVDVKKTVKQGKAAFDVKKILTVRGVIFLLIAVFCLTPWASAPLALLLGLVVAQSIGHPFLNFNHKVTSLLLKASVVGLGFGINFESAVKAGSDGLLFTILSIAATLFIGALLGKLLKVDKKTSYLISSGTAICGGSAIAAIAPVIDAEENQVSVALGTVFILNSVALFLFPEVGKLFHMTQHQFGLWSAIAIHDTSSVVGAASKYGHESLLIATTVKLARSLWIIPLALVSSMMFKKKEQKSYKIKAPWFIALFVGATIIHTYLPQLQPFTRDVVPAAKAGLTLTLFLIGAGLSWKVLKSVGWPPLIQGILTWAAISIVTLLMVLGVAL